MLRLKDSRDLAGILGPGGDLAQSSVPARRVSPSMISINTPSSSRSKVLRGACVQRCGKRNFSIAE